MIGRQGEFMPPCAGAHGDGTQDGERSDHPLAPGRM